MFYEEICASLNAKHLDQSTEIYLIFRNFGCARLRRSRSKIATEKNFAISLKINKNIQLNN